MLKEKRNISASSKALVRQLLKDFGDFFGKLDGLEREILERREYKDDPVVSESARKKAIRTSLPKKPKAISATPQLPFMIGEDAEKSVKKSAGSPSAINSNAPLISK